MVPKLRAEREGGRVSLAFPPQDDRADEFSPYHRKFSLPTRRTSARTDAGSERAERDAREDLRKAAEKSASNGTRAMARGSTTVFKGFRDKQLDSERVRGASRARESTNTIPPPAGNRFHSRATASSTETEDESGGWVSR